MDETQGQIKQRASVELQAAIQDEDVETLYFNGFINARGPSDVLIVLMRNNKHIALLNTSYTVAKTLAQELEALIEAVEKDTGNTIMTVDEMTASQSRGTP